MDFADFFYEKIGLSTNDSQMMEDKLKDIADNFRENKKGKRKKEGFTVNLPLENGQYIHLEGFYALKGRINEVHLNDIEICGIDQYIDFQLAAKNITKELQKV